MTSEKPMGERMASAEAWIDGHEDLCAQRYSELKTAIADVKKAVGGIGDTSKLVVRGVFGILLALIAWLGIQLWHGHLSELQPQVQPAPIAQPVQR